LGPNRFGEEEAKGNANPRILKKWRPDNWFWRNSTGRRSTPKNDVFGFFEIANCVENGHNQFNGRADPYGREMIYFLRMPVPLWISGWIQCSSIELQLFSSFCTPFPRYRKEVNIRQPLVSWCSFWIKWNEPSFFKYGNRKWHLRLEMILQFDCVLFTLSMLQTWVVAIAPSVSFLILAGQYWSRVLRKISSKLLDIDIYKRCDSLSLYLQWRW